MTDNKKDSNPKDALGIKKVPLHAVPVKPLLEVGLAMMEGGRKYGTHNYRAVGVKVSTYYDAVMRHMMAWWEGEDIDSVSGLPHLVKAAASIFVVRDGILMGNCVDDRPIQYPGGIDMVKFNNLAADMITKYPECAKPFTMHSDIKAAGPKPTHKLDDSKFDKFIAQCKVDDILEEIESEPQFKAGDKIRIELRGGAGKNIRERCEKVGNIGTYFKRAGTGQSKMATHLLTLRDGGASPYFYTDELTLLVEDN